MDTLKEFWFIITAFVAGVVWMVRLEGRANSNTDDISKFLREIEKLESRIEKQRAEDQAANAVHREDVKASLKSIQEDIKTLLARYNGG